MHQLIVALPAGGEHLTTTIIVNGKPKVVADYATVSGVICYVVVVFPLIIGLQVQGILIGVVAAFVIFITIIGPEYVLFICSNATSQYALSETMDRTSSNIRLHSRRVLQMTTC